MWCKYDVDDDDDDEEKDVSDDLLHLRVCAFWLK